jgi:FkbM family methyltransferase
MRRAVVWGAAVAAAGVAIAAFELVDWRVVRLAFTRDHRCSIGDARRSVEAFGDRWDRIYEISDTLHIVQSDPAGFELAATPKQRYWIPRQNRLALAEVMAEEEEDVYADRGWGARAGDTVLDCGANVGVYTRRALDAGARLVVAIEPAPENVECLRRNFQEEIRAGRVIVYPKGVWDKDDVLVLRVLPGQSGSGSVAMDRPGANEAVRVPLTTIDELAQELHLERVDFIKMDIEGAERKALAGARRTVERFQTRMAISLEHRKDDPDAITAEINRLWPRMKTECGPCVWVKTEYVNRVAPEVLFARF